MFLERIHNQSRCQNRTNPSILIVVGCLIGCGHTRMVEVQTNQPFVKNVDEFLPLDSASAGSMFVVDGSKTNYKLQTKREGTVVRFQATSDGNIVDEEIYDVQENTILLKAAAGENFEPPVTLIKFPLSVGDQYKWKGKLKCEIEHINANAIITTSTDFVQCKDKCDDAIKAEMNLKFGEGANRKLSFWFVKGKGIVRTEMSKNIREPEH
jgi:hypothetical protein